MKSLIVAIVLAFGLIVAGFVLHNNNAQANVVACGIRPLEIKPLQVGCRDMVQQCACNGRTCAWVWVCIPY